MSAGASERQQHTVSAYTIVLCLSHSILRHHSTSHVHAINFGLKGSSLVMRGFDRPTMPVLRFLIAIGPGNQVDQSDTLSLSCPHTIFAIRKQQLVFCYIVQYAILPVMHRMSLFTADPRWNNEQQAAPHTSGNLRHCGPMQQKLFLCSPPWFHIMRSCHHVFRFTPFVPGTSSPAASRLCLGGCLGRLLRLTPVSSSGLGGGSRVHTPSGRLSVTSFAKVTAALIALATADSAAAFPPLTLRLWSPPSTLYTCQDSLN